MQVETVSSAFCSLRPGFCLCAEAPSSPPLPPAPLTRLAPASDFREPGSAQGTAGVGESRWSPRPDFGPRSRFLPRPASGTRMRVGSREVGEQNRRSEVSASRTSARPLVLVGSPPAFFRPRDWLVLVTPGARPMSTQGASARSARPLVRRPTPLA